jgi:two-component system nitrogen regulation response regulator NtrX
VRLVGDILVLDGDRPTLDFIAEALGDEGYMIRTAQYIQTALAAIQQRRPDLVLLDLPVLYRSTSSLLDALRDNRAARLPIIAMTTNAKIAEELLALSFTDCLVKPFTLTELLDCVGRHIRSS